MSSRRQFSTEFKAEAIELVISSGCPVAQVATEIGVKEGLDTAMDQFNEFLMSSVGTARLEDTPPN